MDVNFKVLVSKEQAEQAWNDIQAKMTAVQGTAKDMTQTLGEVKAKLAETKVGSDAWRELAQKAKLAEDEIKRVQQATIQAANGNKQLIGGVGQMNQTLGQFGFLLGDADMFMVNFRMGMMSIANNVPMVVQGLTRVQEEAKATGTAFGTVLKNSLVGPGGVMLGVNALMLALNILPKLFEGTTDKIKDQAKSVSELAGEYENLTKQQLKSRQSDVQKQLEQYTNELNDKYGRSKTFLGIRYNSVMPSGEMTEAEKVKYENLLNQNQALSEQIKKTGYLKDIVNTIAMLEKKRSELPEDQKHAYDEQIKYYKKLHQEANKAIDITPDKTAQRLEKSLMGDLQSWSETRLKMEEDLLKKEVKAFRDAKIEETEITAYETAKQLDIDLRRLQRIQNEQRYKSSGGIKSVQAILPSAIPDWRHADMEKIEKDLKNPPMDAQALKDFDKLLLEAKKKEAYLLNDVAESFGDTLADAGVSAFKRMVGEGENIFQKFLISIGDKMFNRLGNSLTDSIFQSLDSGSSKGSSITDIITTILPFLSKAGGTTKITMNLDGKAIGEAILTPHSVVNTIAQAQSMRLIN